MLLKIPLLRGVSRLSVTAYPAIKREGVLTIVRLFPHEILRRFTPQNWVK